MRPPVKLVLCNEPWLCETVKALEAEKAAVVGSLVERFQHILSEEFDEPPVNFLKAAERLVGAIPWGTEREILLRENKALNTRLREVEKEYLRLKHRVINRDIDDYKPTGDAPVLVSGEEETERVCSNCGRWTPDKTNDVFGGCPQMDHNASPWNHLCNKWTQKTEEKEASR